MAIRTFEPFPAALCPDSSLDIQNMFAHVFNLIQIIMNLENITNITQLVF